MRRREFVGGLAGAAVWSLPAHTQTPAHIGALMAFGEHDPVEKARVAAFIAGCGPDTSQNRISRPSRKTCADP
jgi:hypothetical protein